VPGKPTLNERVYSDIKAELLRGDFRPGERLDSRSFEARYRTSSTPVRMALSRLAGERLIVMSNQDGFHTPFVTEAWLYDLFEAEEALLRLCLKRCRPGSDLPALALNLQAEPTEPSVEALFLAIAQATHNAELAHTVRSLNDRLHLVREKTRSLFSAEAADIQLMHEAWSRRELSVLAERLKLYHRRRMASARQIVALIHSKA